MGHNLKEEEMIINDKLVTSVQIGFENMEYYTIPVECIQHLELEQLENGKCEISCHIIDNGKIDNSWGERDLTFAQRTNKYNDVTNIAFICEDGTQYEFSPVWYHDENDEYWYQYDQTNEYQKTTFHSCKEVEFSIVKHNKIYTTKEVLIIGMNKETIFEDEFEIKYLSKGGALFLLEDTQPVNLSLDILNAKFTKVD